MMVLVVVWPMRVVVVAGVLVLKVVMVVIGVLVEVMVVVEVVSGSRNTRPGDD